MPGGLSEPLGKWVAGNLQLCDLQQIHHEDTGHLLDPVYLLVLVSSDRGEGCLGEEEGGLEIVRSWRGDVKHWLVLVHRVEADLRGIGGFTTVSRCHG